MNKGTKGSKLQQLLIFAAFFWPVATGSVSQYLFCSPPSLSAELRNYYTFQDILAVSRL